MPKNVSAMKIIKPKISDTPAPLVNVSIETDHWRELDFDPAATVNDAIHLALKNAELPDPRLGGRVLEMTALLSDDMSVHALNQQYREMDKPTNVLSFATIDDPDYEQILGAQPDEFYLGDIILAYETVAREAEAFNIPLRNHLIYLAIHGGLHLLGYDHIEDEDAQEMESLEIRLLAGLDIENPYEL